MGVLKRIERRKKSKIKKALKSYRGRFWKNLAIFMAGVFSSGFILAGVSALVLKFVPMSKIPGNDKVVSGELSDKSILDVLLGFKNATVDDYVIVTTLIDALQNAEVAGKKIKDFVYIDTEKLSGAKLLELGPALKDAITVTATLYSTVGADNLNKYGIGKITAFNEFLPVMVEVKGEDGESMDVHVAVKEKVTDDESFKASLYYYKVADGVEVDGSIKVTDGEYAGTYARAYNNDKSLKEGVDNETLLYYAAVTKVPITDAVGLLTDTVGRVKATELLDVFGASIEEEDSVFGKLLEGRTIKDLTNLTVDDIMVGDLLEVETTDVLYKILTDALGDWDTISVGALSSLGNDEINKVRVASFFDTATDDMKSLFVDLVNSNKEDGAVDLTWEDITIGNLQNIDGFDSIKLSSVMTDVYPVGYVYTYTENGEEKTKTITKEDSEYSLIADILLDANAENWLDDEGEPLEGFEDINAKWNSLTVSGITSLTSFDNVRLSLVMDNPGELKDVLEDITNTPYEQIKVSNLNGLTIAELHLSSVMKNIADDNPIKDVLVQATGDSWENIQVQDLTGNLSFDSVELETVMGGSLNGNMSDILREALNKPTGNITVGDLKGGFEITEVKLSTLGISAGEDKDGDGVVDEGEENKILKAILGDSNTTVGNIGASINNLSLYEIFGQECFKDVNTPGATFVDTTTLFAKEDIDTDGDGIADAVAFVHEEDSYFEENEAIKYALCANDGMWLLLCFDFGHVDARWEESALGEVKVGTGRPEEYIISDLTFNDLTSGTAVTDKFEKATIAQLVDSGILESANEKLMPYTLAEALNKLSDLMP